MFDSWNLIVCVVSIINIVIIVIFLKKRNFSKKLFFMFFLLLCLDVYVSFQNMEYMKKMNNSSQNINLPRN